MKQLISYHFDSESLVTSSLCMYENPNLHHQSACSMAMVLATVFDGYTHYSMIDDLGTFSKYYPVQEIVENFVTRVFRCAVT